jgi:hypothetical protein
MSLLYVKKDEITKPIRCVGCRKLYADRNSFRDHVLCCKLLSEIKEKNKDMEMM